MKKVGLLSYCLIIFVFFINAISTFAQAKTTPACSVDKSLVLRGFHLGQTPEEITLLIADFQGAFAQNKPDEESLVVMNSSEIFYRSPGVRQVANIDTIAEAEIKLIREEVKRRKKVKELERIRQEREKRLVLKP